MIPKTNGPGRYKYLSISCPLGLLSFLSPPLQHISTRHETYLSFLSLGILQAIANGTRLLIMATTNNSEALPFLKTDTPLFADGFPDDSSDVSTVESVTREDEQFIIEAIIADKPDPCAPETSLYLVQWSSYPISRCTWEPAASFMDPETIPDYLSRKSQGKVVPFDWEDWDKKRARENEEKVERRERRAKKREKVELNRTEAPQAKQRFSPTARNRMLARLRNNPPAAEEGGAPRDVGERVLAGGSPVAGRGEASKKRNLARRREKSPVAEEGEKVKKRRLVRKN
jgi:hypothetical protein